MGSISPNTSWRLRSNKVDAVWDMVFLRLLSSSACALAGPEAEREYCGPITDNSDRVDYQMAYEYLARQLIPLQVGTEFTRCRDAAQRLVCSPWAQRRIVAIADALLRHGTLTGEQISAIKVSSLRY
jgi:hypothetical protein